MLRAWLRESRASARTSRRRPAGNPGGGLRRGGHDAAQDAARASAVLPKPFGRPVTNGSEQRLQLLELRRVQRAEHMLSRFRERRKNLIDHFLAGVSQFEKHEPPVPWVAHTGNESAPLQPVGEFRGALRFLSQLPGDLREGQCPVFPAENVEHRGLRIRQAKTRGYRFKVSRRQYMRLLKEIPGAQGLVRLWIRHEFTTIPYELNCEIAPRTHHWYMDCPVRAECVLRPWPRCQPGASAKDGDRRRSPPTRHLFLSRQRTALCPFAGRDKCAYFVRRTGHVRLHGSIERAHLAASTSVVPHAGRQILAVARVGSMLVLPSRFKQERGRPSPGLPVTGECCL